MVSSTKGWGVCSEHATADHRHDDLGHTGVEIVGLDSESRGVRRLEIGVREQDETDGAAAKSLLSFTTAHTVRVLRSVPYTPRALAGVAPGLAVR